jgi:hypothetical protein
VERYFSWEHQRERYLAVFERMLAGNGEGLLTAQVMDQRR